MFVTTVAAHVAVELCRNSIVGRDRLKGTLERVKCVKLHSENASCRAALDRTLPAENPLPFD